MGYVATKGGSAAVLCAEQLVDYFRLKGTSEPLTLGQIQDQLRLAVDRAMSEGGLYAPELAALALKQSEGDSIEASFLLRAYRSTLPRLAYSLPAHGARMRLFRRISATFKDIPGGQLLGPTRDYHLRLLNKVLATENNATLQKFVAEFEATVPAITPDSELGIYPKVIDSMRERGLLADVPGDEKSEAEPYDITRQAIQFPTPRSARLQVMARGEVGGLLALAYSSVRGYGDAHPTLGELRVGYLPVEIAHPLTGEAVEIGELIATECDMVSRVHSSEDDRSQADAPATAKFGLGYGFSFGQSEVKAISMSILDRVISAAKERSVHGKTGPAADEEFVLQHVDGIEASGFTAHFKLPHYVTFQADIKVLEQTREFQAEQYSQQAEIRQRIAAEANEQVARAKAFDYESEAEDE